MLHNSQVSLGDHCWAAWKSTGELVVILKVTFTSYYICGGWECEEEAFMFDILEVIPVPTAYTTRVLSEYSAED